MNIRHAIIPAVLAALFAAPVLAADKADIRVLAEHSGLSETQVRMVLRGRTAYHHRFPQHFDRIERQLIDSLDKGDYQRLTSGESIVLRSREPAATVATTIKPR